MEFDKTKFQEIEKEVDKMTLEELLFVRMAPQTYLNKKYENEIKNSNQLVGEIETANIDIKRNEEAINKQKSMIYNECKNLKSEIEQCQGRIKNLINQKNQLLQKPTKEAFINELDGEIKKNFKTPDNCFREFLTRKISQNEFFDFMKKCGTGKDYYYYKILSDRLKEV